MCNYAVVTSGGTQLLVEPERIYDIQRIKFNPGDRVLLPQVLFASKKADFILGHPCADNVAIVAVVLGHSKSKKIEVFKMKSKKKTRKKKSCRILFSRVLVDSISIIS